MLGALIMFGLQPGPLLMMQSGDVVWGMIAGLVLANLLLLFSNVLLIPLFINVLRFSQRHLAAGVTALCLVGAFSLNYTVFNVWITVIFGVIGYLMRKNDYPTGPFILSVVLAPMAENYFRQSIMLAQGSWSIFVDRPIALALIVIMAATIVIGAIGKSQAVKRTIKRYM